MSRRLVAAAWITGTTLPLLGPETDDQKAQPPSTTPEKQEPIKRLAIDLSSGFRIPVLSYEQRAFLANASGGHRSFITLGALRCDQDVGCTFWSRPS